MMTQEEITGLRSELTFLLRAIHDHQQQQPSPVPPATQNGFSRYDAMMAALQTFCFLLNEEEDELPEWKGK